MNKSKTIKKIKELESMDKRLGAFGLSIHVEGENPRFFKTYAQFINEVEGVNFDKMYKVELAVDCIKFLKIALVIVPLKRDEINKPLRLVKIARNINAFDLYFERIDGSKRNFWANLSKTLNKIIQTLSEKEIKTLKGLVKDENKLQFFSI